MNSYLKFSSESDCSSMHAISSGVSPYFDYALICSSMEYFRSSSSSMSVTMLIKSRKLWKVAARWNTFYPFWSMLFAMPIRVSFETIDL